MEDQEIVKPEEKPVRPQNKNLRPPFQKGEKVAGQGRKKGQRNYATIYREALNKLAYKNKMSPDDIETGMLTKAILSARKGDYRFLKDILDRLYGTATVRADITTDGEKINSVPPNTAMLEEMITRIEEELKAKSLTKND